MSCIDNIFFTIIKFAFYSENFLVTFICFEYVSIWARSWYVKFDFITESVFAESNIHRLWGVAVHVLFLDESVLIRFIHHYARALIVPKAQPFICRWNFDLIMKSFNVRWVRKILLSFFWVVFYYFKYHILSGVPGDFFPTTKDVYTRPWCALNACCTEGTGRTYMYLLFFFFYILQNFFHY